MDVIRQAKAVAVIFLNKIKITLSVIRWYLVNRNQIVTSPVLLFYHIFLTFTTLPKKLCICAVTLVIFL